MSGNEFRFFLSCDINLPVTFRIERLEGKLSPRNPPDSADDDCTIEERKPELYVESLLYIDGAPVGLPMRTRLESVGPSYCWNELITLNTKYRDLTANRQLGLTVYDVSCGKNEELVGGATIHLFNMKKQLKTAKHKLRLWFGKEADGSINTTTPGKVPKEERGELERLEKLLNKYESGQIQRVDWLDRLAFKSIEKIKECESAKNGTSHLYIVVDFCSFEHRVVFQILQEAFAALKIAEKKFTCVSKSRILLVKLQLLHEFALHRGHLKLAQQYCDELGVLASSVTGVDLELKSEASLRHARTLLAANQYSEAATVAHSLFCTCYKFNMQVKNATVLLLLAEIHKSFNLDLLKASVTLILAELWLSLGSNYTRKALALLHGSFPMVVWSLDVEHL